MFTKNYLQQQLQYITPKLALSDIEKLSPELPGFWAVKDTNSIIMIGSALSTKSLWL